MSSFCNYFVNNFVYKGYYFHKIHIYQSEFPYKPLNYLWTNKKALRRKAFILSLIFNGGWLKIFINHQCNFKYNCIVKFTQIKPSDFLDFLKAVNKCVSVNKQFTACFGNIEVIFKKFLNGKQGFLIQWFYRPICASLNECASSLIPVTQVPIPTTALQ